MLPGVDGKIRNPEWFSRSFAVRVRRARREFRDDVRR